VHIRTDLRIPPTPGAPASLMRPRPPTHRVQERHPRGIAHNLGKLDQEGSATRREYRRHLLQDQHRASTPAATETTTTEFDLICVSAVEATWDYLSLTFFISSCGRPSGPSLTGGPHGPRDCSSRVLRLRCRPTSTAGATSRPSFTGRLPQEGFCSCEEQGGRRRLAGVLQRRFRTAETHPRRAPPLGGAAATAASLACREPDQLPFGRAKSGAPRRACELEGTCVHPGPPGESHLVESQPTIRARRARFAPVTYRRPAAPATRHGT
jgi:hypothetical protein